MYGNLKFEMDVIGLSIESIARTLEIHRNSASNKINGNSSFSIEEAFKIQKIHFPYADMQYLFKRTNKRNGHDDREEPREPKAG